MFLVFLLLSVHCVTTAVPPSLPRTTNVAVTTDSAAVHICRGTCAMPGEYCSDSYSCHGKNYFCIGFKCQYRNWSEYPLMGIRW
ncbi:hypothetical protein J6590_019593 [Homalodisca vitripennis]|nr:hypothetical protein J6590_019593 [Homalodisca vitripennis]